MLAQWKEKGLLATGWAGVTWSFSQLLQEADLYLQVKHSLSAGY